MTQTRMLPSNGFPFDAARRRTDHGLFGPDSPTWRVWTNTTALIGFQRSVVVESFDPFLTAAVNDANGVRYDARGRLNATLQYFTVVAVGDSRSAIELSELLMKVHARATGIEPVSGRRYSANDPASQLWIHVTGWHSVLYAYERFGPGPLSAEDEARYWRECVRAAELQTCKAADVPSSRGEVREYFAQERGRLCVSEGALSLINHLLYPPRQPGDPVFAPAGHLLARATLTTLPGHLKDLAGLRQTRAESAAAVAGFKAFNAVAGSSAALRLRVAETFAPSVALVWRQALHGEPPLEDVVRTPAEARARYGSRATAIDPASVGA